MVYEQCAKASQYCGKMHPSKQHTMTLRRSHRVMLNSCEVRSEHRSEPFPSKSGRINSTLWFPQAQRSERLRALSCHPTLSLCPLHVLDASAQATRVRRIIAPGPPPQSYATAFCASHILNVVYNWVDCVVLLIMKLEHGSIDMTF